MPPRLISTVLTVVLVTMFAMPASLTVRPAHPQPAQGPTVTVTIASGSPTSIISYNAGDTVSITAVLNTSDPNENGEGEPLVLQSSTGFSRVVSDYALPASFPFTATAPGVLSGYISGFDGDETASVTVTLNSNSVKLGFLTDADRRYLHDVGNLYEDVGGGSLVIAAACSEGVITIPSCTLPFGTFGAVVALTGLVLNQLAADPSDPNFMVIAQPIFPAFPPVVAGGGVTAAEAAAANALLNNEAQIIGYTGAIITSLNRAQGAFDVGNNFWVIQQMQAARQYEGTLVQLLNAEIPLRTSLVNLLAADPGFPAIVITPSQVFQYEASVASSGLPASVVQLLTQLGADGATIDTIRSVMIVRDINAVAGSYPAKLANPQLLNTIQQLTAGLGSLCLQDSNSGSTMVVNQNTGDYQFIDCRKNIVLTGKGAVTVNSCKVNLIDFGPDPKRPDRNVQVLINTCTGAASGSLQISSPKLSLTISDSNMRAHACVCR